MIALIVLFATGLVSMFISFVRKPILVGSVATIGLISGMFALVYEFKNNIVLFPSYDGLALDPLAVLFTTICILFTLLLIWGGFKPLTKRVQNAGDHVSLLIFSLCGALIMTSFTDFFMFFLGLEILSIPVYVLAGMNKTELGSEASLKYFLTGAFSTGILLFGVAWIYGATGSFALSEIQLAILSTEEHSVILYVGILLVLASFLFKIGAVPYHFWSPDVYSGSPMTIMGYMASVIKLAGFAALLRLFTITLGATSDVWMPIIVAVSVLSMFLGNLSAIKQTRIRRLLAFSSIAHVGYTLLAVISFESVEAAIYYYNVYYYLFAYGLATIILVVAGNVIDDEEDLIANWSGLARRNPLLGLFVIMALLSLAGVPPLMGFFGKYLVFTQAIGDYPVVVALALLNSGIAAYYYLRVIITTLKKPEENPIEKETVSLLQWVVLVVSASLLLLGGLLLPLA